MFNQSVCALRFFYGVCLGKKDLIEHVPFPKQPKKLPVVLSRKEVTTLFEAVKNVKHRTILMTLYASGARISEAMALQLRDIDSARMLIHIRGGKGDKDRYVPLSTTLLDRLRLYWLQERPPLWLFPGTDPDRPLTAHATQLVCKKAGRKAGLTKHLTPHTLRHTFATHHPSPITWKREQTCDRSRSCSDTAVSARRRSTCTWPLRRWEVLGRGLTSWRRRSLLNRGPLLWPDAAASARSGRGLPHLSRRTQYPPSGIVR